MHRRMAASALLLTLALAGSWGASAQSQDKGVAEIVLSGGISGPVHFPHQRHQERLGDCTICHAAYPQKAGAIETLKAEGKLAKKEIMDTQCTKCHKEKKRAGEKAGPTTCTTCHIKS
jgi:hypothetical protein